MKRTVTSIYKNTVTMAIHNKEANLFIIENLQAFVVIYVLLFSHNSSKHFFEFI